MVDVWLPKGTHILDTQRQVAEIEQYVHNLKMPDGSKPVKNVASFVGQGGLRFLLTYAPEKLDSGYAQLLVTVGDWPAGGAIVYRIGEHGPVYLGTAGPDGMLRAVGLEEGDEIRVYHRDRHGVTKTVFRASMSDLVGGYAVLALPVPGWLAVGVPRGSDERSPGAAVDA